MMLHVNDGMKIVSVKRLAPRCIQTKILLDDIFYKRIIFEHKNNNIIQWLMDGEFVSSDTEKILEKIFSEIESD